MHPSTVQEIAALFFQGRRPKANKIAKKMREKGQLPCIGSIRGNDGRPWDLYCGWQVKEDNYEHELALTRFCALYYGAATFLRGPDVDRASLPDAEAWFGQLHYHFELDRGTERGTAIRERMHVVRDPEVLWICRTQERVASLLAIAPGPRHWFTTLDVIQADPWGEVWVNNQEERGTLKQ